MTSAQDLTQYLAVVPGAGVDAPVRKLALVPFDDRMNCLALLMSGSPLDLSRNSLALIPAIPEAAHARLEEEQLHNKHACLAIFPTTRDAVTTDNQHRTLALIPKRIDDQDSFSSLASCLSIEPTTPQAAMADKRHCIAIIPTNPDTPAISNTGFTIVPTTPDAAIRDAASCFAIIPTSPDLPLADQKTVLAVMAAPSQEAYSSSSSSSTTLSIAGPSSSSSAENALVTVLPSPSTAYDQSRFFNAGESSSESPPPPQPEMIVAHLIKVGLAERAQIVMDRLLHEEEEGRVIGVSIVGESGVGKTAILKEILSKLKKKGEHLIGYGETTLSPSREALADIISCIIHQVGGDTRQVYCTTSEAREGLAKQLLQLRYEKKKVCLALDNVWAGAVLREMLPKNLGQMLFPGSHLLVTTSSDSVAMVVDELWKPITGSSSSSSSSNSIYWQYYPEHLSLPEAKEMFILHATKRGVELLPEHEQLVENLVPLCGGLPLVLQVVGSHFARFARRKKDEWGNITRKMQVAQEFQVREDEICSKLKVIYDGLDSTAQEAFLDVATFFRGANWKAVERSLGKHQLASLADQAFVFAKPKEHWYCHDNGECRHSMRLATQVVEMHDLVYSLGFQLSKGNYVISNDSPRLPQSLHNKGELSTIRGLKVKRCEEAFPVGLIDKMRKLHVLIFEGTSLSGHCHRPPHQLRYLVWHPIDQGKDRAGIPFKLKRLHKLLVAHLHNIRSDFSDIDFPSKLVELELDNCVKLVELPRSIGNLKWLHSLHLHNCHSLRSLPESIGGLVMLQELVLSVCTSISELPVSIGNLHDLEYLDLAACFKLMSLPKTIGKLKSLKVIDLTGCESLTELPGEIGELENLKELILAGCGSLKQLPPQIGSLVHLTTLDVSHCEQLITLPAQIGNLIALKELNLMWCEKLTVLPPQLGFLHTVTELELSDCRSLREVPVTIGNLGSLKRFHVRGCCELRILPAEIGGLKCVTSLDLRGCVNLENLPVAEIVRMKQLTSLGVEFSSAVRIWNILQHLIFLKRLDVDDKNGSCIMIPSKIWDIPSLEKLSLKGFRMATGFADGIWNLPNLTSLWMEGFTNITFIPQQISSLRTLNFLVLAEFNSLNALPSGITELLKLERLSVRCKKIELLNTHMFKGMVKLRWLGLTECVSLKRLEMTSAAVNLDSIEILDLVGCSALENIPPNLLLACKKSLQRLNCRDCTSLKNIPDEIGEMSKLEALYLQNCSSLGNIPSQVGNLHMLQRLDMKKCTGITSLPIEIGMLSKLKYLHLSGSSSLKELPHHIGQLACLSELGLEGCVSLTKIPSSIGRLSCLENLSLDSCTSLTEIPSEIGNLSSLKRFSLANCISINTLPSEIGKLSKLKLLRLDGCSSLRELSIELRHLHSLVSLGLEGCTSISILPTSSSYISSSSSSNYDAIFKLPNLEFIDLRRCPLAQQLTHLHHIHPSCTLVTNDVDWEGFEDVWLYY